MRLQLAFPGRFSFHRCRSDYYQYITMHGMSMVVYVLTAVFLGGLRQLPHPADGRRPGHGVPLREHAELLDLPRSRSLVLASTFFVPGGPTGAGWTLYPPQAILAGTPGRDWGIVLMLASLMLFIIGFTMGGLNYVVTVLQGRARGMTLMRLPLTVWGILTATVMALLAFPALLVGAVMMLFDRLLGTSFFMPAIVEAGTHLPHGGGSPILWQHPVLVLRAPGGLHRRPAGLRHRVRPHQRPRAQEHLRLPHDGVGHRGDRRRSASPCGGTICTSAA